MLTLLVQRPNFNKVRLQKVLGEDICLEDRTKYKQDTGREGQNN
jgi:hypothetical protein